MTGLVQFDKPEFGIEFVPIKSVAVICQFVNGASGDKNTN
jgi:hypothetical protein